jgi:hypothetical protein
VTACIVSRLCVHTAAARPYWEALARVMTSSRVEYFRMTCGVVR